jgi:uncharacterized protein (TIGR00251 family)
MKIKVQVKPNSKKEEVIEVNQNEFKVLVQEPPIKGRANRALVKVIAKYFDVPTDKIEIISGVTSRIKVLEIYD